MDTVKHKTSSIIIGKDARKEKTMSYGDNRANEKEVSLSDCKYMSFSFDFSVEQVLKGNGYTKDDILQLAQKSQEITDALNHLYEQMKG